MKKVYFQYLKSYKPVKKKKTFNNKNNENINKNKLIKKQLANIILS